MSAIDVYTMCLATDCHFKIPDQAPKLSELLPTQEVEFGFSFLQAPTEAYDALNSCDVPCFEDCISMIDYFGLDMVDQCAAKKCDCYMSAF